MPAVAGSATMVVMSRLDHLYERDVVIVCECLTAAVRGSFFPEWEFQTLMGLERTEVEQVLETWPDARDLERQDTAVSNVLNMLLGYPHDEWRAWQTYISASPEEVGTVLARWRGDPALDESPRGFFDRLR